MNYTKIIEEIRQEVTHFFRDHEKAGIVYHNLSHMFREKGYLKENL